MVTTKEFLFSLCNSSGVAGFEFRETASLVNAVGDRVFFHRDNSGGRLYSANLDDSDIRQITETSIDNTNIVGDRVFFSQTNRITAGVEYVGGLFSINIDGTNKQRIYEFVSYSIGNIDADDDYVYILASAPIDDGFGHNQLYRMRHNGSGIEKIASIDMSVQYMILCGDRIIFTDTVGW